MVRIEKANCYKNTTIKGVKKLSLAAFVFFLFTGCSQYKSSWSCKNPEGIGCSSIGYADIIARKNIILNDDQNVEQKSRVTKKNNYNNKKKQSYKKLLIKERYSDFKQHDKQEVDFD